jgi:hypothetical protein
MKTYRAASPLLTLAVDEGKWSALHPGRFTPRDIAHGTYWIGGCLDPRASLDTMKKRKILPLLGIKSWPSSP